MSLTTPRSNPTQLLASTNNYAIAPKPVSTSWSKISTGVSHVLGIKSNGKLYAWGYNDQGQLGDSTTVTKSSPVQIGNSTWNDAHAGPNYSIALSNDYIAFGWGYNDNGQLGDTITTGTYRSSPVQVNSTSWNSIATGTNHVIALKSDNTLWGWGTNSFGQLGQEWYSAFSSPVQISSSTYSSIDAGNNYSLAINSDYNLVAFGDDSAGQLGYTVPNTTVYSWTMIADGNENTLAIRSDGLLFGWGTNSFGQLGQNDVVPRSSPTQIGTTSWSKVAVGASTQVLAITTLGKLFVWGNNIAGELGTNDVILRSSPVQISTSSWSQVSAGASYSVGITTDGAMFGWGLNSSGQLGIDDTLNRSSPVQVGTSSWSQLSAGFNYTMALKTDSTLWSWGNNSSGQIGINDTLNRSSPVQVGTSSWSLIAANQLTSAAVKLNKKLFTWGDGRASQLGNNTITSRSSPVQVHSNDWSTNANTQVGWSGTLTTGGSLGIQSDGSLWYWGYPRSVSTNTAGGDYSWSQISAGRSHTAAIRSDGRLFVWGLGANGQLGQSDTFNRSSPTQIGANLANEGEFWYSVSVMESRTVAIRCDNTLWVWGINNGYVGLADSVARSSPTQLTGAPTSSYTQVYAGESYTIASTSAGTAYYWTSTLPASGFLLTIGTGTYNRISAGNSNALVIDSNYKAYSWGDNAYGQLGTSIAPLEWSTVFQDKAGISLGPDVIFALRSDSTLWVWGTNRSGVFGTNEEHNVARSSPVQVPGSWSSVGVGQSYAIGIQTNGTLWGWGYNQSGVLWDAYTINTARSSPVQMGAGTNWSKLSVGSSNAAAINTSGQLYTWGNNTSAQLGIGDQITRSSPVQVSGSWSIISNSTTPQGFEPFALGIQTNGTLWGWGGNTNGQLGNFTATYSSVPSQIGTLTNWRFAAAGWLSGFAIRDDYTLWGWGYNSNGELGQNVIVPANRSSPIQIATNNFFSSLSISAFTMFATKLDGTILAWGSGNSGGTGFGTIVARSSPTQIGTLSWSAIAASLSTTAGITAGGVPGTTGTLNNLYGWGLNISNGTAIFRSSPVQINAGTQSYVTTVSAAVQIGTSSWISVAAGTSHSLGVTSLGKMFAWGDNSNQRLGYLVSTTVLTLSSNATTAYIRSSDNSLYTWGYNAAGQIGDGTTVTKSVPTNITLLNGIKFKNIAQARNSVNGYTLAIDSVNSMLWAWGANVSGYIGTNDTLNRSFPVQISRDSWSQIAVGLNHSIAIKSDGTLWGWGSQPQAGYLSWRSISSGVDHTLAIRSDFALFVWGGNAVGQLGDSSVVAKSAPVRIFADRLITSVSAGASYSMAIDNESRLWAWGLNSIGQLGNNATVNRLSPIQVDTSSWTQVSAGGFHTLAIKLGGTVWAWGAGIWGALGPQFANLNRSSPVQVGASFSLVSAGGGTAGLAFSAAIKSDGKLFTWGYNANGQLGQGDLINRSSPVQVGTSSWTTVSSGVSHMMGITTDGSLYGWGLNTAGAIGDGTTVTKSNPTIVYVPAVVTQSWSQVQAGNSRSVGLLSGRLYTWGSNTSGALGYTGADWRFVGLGAALDNNGKLYTWGDLTGSGQNTTALRSSPVQLGTSSWIAVGSTSGIAIRVDGTLWAWYQQSGGAGSNFGQPGQNDIINRSSPVQVGVDTDWVFVDSSELGRAAIKRDGRLYTWGRNQHGQLGLGDAIARSSPVQVPGSWTQVTMGNTSLNTFAIRTDGTLYGWGYNAQGNLGVGDASNKNSPVQISGGGSWSMVRTTGNGTYVWALGIKTDGTLWGWGDNTGGGIGDNTTISRSSPIQVGTSSWSMIAASGGSAGISAFKLFTWGGGTGGALGDGTTNRRSSPVQVATSSWTFISSSINGMFGIVGVQGFNSALFSWGDNNVLYYLGNATSSSRSSPVQIQAAIAGLGTGSLYPIQVDTIGGNVPRSWSIINTSRGGGDRTIAAVNDQLLNLFNWGAGTLGGLGLGDSINRSSPVQLGNTIILAGTRSSPSQISASTDWSVIAAVDSASFAIKTNGTLWTWGTNTDGRMGLNDTLNRSSIVQIGSETNWSSLAGGRAFVLARTTTNVVFAWGQNSYGQLGILNSTINRSSPVQVGTDYTSISAGESSSIALDTLGRVWNWGYNLDGNLGNDTAISRSSPVQVTSLPASIETIAAGSLTHFATKGSVLYGWGSGTSGQIGDGTIISKSSPVQVTTFWYSIGNTASSPVQIGTDSSWTIVSAGINNSLAISSANTLFSWGNNDTGQLGLNNTANRSSPTQIGTSSFSSISVGGAASFALRSPSNVISGFGAGNAVGSNSVINRSSPVQVFSTSQGSTALVPFKLLAVGTSSWSMVAVGKSGGTSGPSALALASNGLLYAWGTGTIGLIGNNNINTVTSSPIQVGNIPRTFYYSPTVVDSTNSYIAVSAGFSHALAIRSNNTLYGWGNIVAAGTAGIPTTASWKKILSDGQYFMARRGDDTLWVWGKNDFGQLGLGDTLNRSLPVQLGTDT